MRTPTTVDIDGFSFTFSPRPAMKNFDDVGRVAGFLAPLLPLAKGLDADVLSVIKPEALFTLGDGLKWFRETHLADVLVQPPGSDKQARFSSIADTIFQDSLDTVAKLLLEVLKVNYGSFLRGLAAKPVAK